MPRITAHKAKSILFRMFLLSAILGLVRRSGPGGASAAGEELVQAPCLLWPRPGTTIALSCGRSVLS